MKPYLVRIEQYVVPNDISRKLFEGWHIDLFSTFLSREHSEHRVEGGVPWVKTKKEVGDER